jgi:D-beta-D-heptose 7-phosphate kinase / D-beta-D-heptose 1-phosphate adenosyltransferase
MREKMSPDLTELLLQFKSQHVIVIGDVMLDRYWMGEASRISPEAPVPIVRKQETVCSPGGAGNVALNAAALGARVTLLGVVGDDQAGGELRRSLTAGGVSPDCLLTDPGRVTTVKTRVIANRQQITRIDEEDTHALATAQEFALLESLRTWLVSCGCILVSDYAKGLMSASLAAGLLAIARENNIPVIVDPKGTDALRYRGATVIKPNRSELAALTGLTVRSHADAVSACQRLHVLLPDAVILLTEGPEGMTLSLPGRELVRLPTRALEVFDVTGAGDTALAVAGLAVAGGADFWTAALLANCAAGVVVGEFGCGKISIERLRDALSGADLPRTRNQRAFIGA